MRAGGMQFRHEKKYFISTVSSVIISERLKSTLKKDINVGENGEYTITSLYFDDMYDSAYEEKTAGIMQRYKYRVRIYNHRSNKIMLEKKIKVGDRIAKVTCPISIDEYRALFSRRNLHILLDSPHALLHEVFAMVRTRMLSPRVVVEYEREVLVSDSGNVRITFDKNLRAGIFNLDILKNNSNMVSIINEDKVIMEVKFDTFLPSHIREMVNVKSGEYLSISKYIFCVDAMNLYGGNFYHAKHTIFPGHI